MTPTLRNWHRNLWPILALIMTGISIAAFQALPGKSTVEMPSKIAENGLSFNLNKDRLLLEVEVQQPLTVPSMLLYLSENEADSVENDRLLGRLDAVGKYAFPVDSASIAMPQKIIKGFDPIHRQAIFQKKLN